MQPPSGSRAAAAALASPASALCFLHFSKTQRIFSTSKLLDNLASARPKSFSPFSSMKQWTFTFRTRQPLPPPFAQSLSVSRSLSFENVFENSIASILRRIVMALSLSLARTLSVCGYFSKSFLKVFPFSTLRILICILHPTLWILGAALRNQYMFRYLKWVCGSRCEQLAKFCRFGNWNKTKDRWFNEPCCGAGALTQVKAR